MDECGLPPGWLNVVTGSGGTVGDPLVEHPDVAVITFTGSPEVGWAIAAKAAEKHVGLELGNNAPVIIEPVGRLGRRRPPRSPWPGSATPASRASPPSGSTCTATSSQALHRRPRRPRWRRSWSATRSTRPPTCRRSSASKETERVKGWIDEAVAGGATVLAGGDLVDGVLRAHRAGRRHPRHGRVPVRGVRPGRRRSSPTTTSTTPSPRPTTPATGSRPPCSPPTSTPRCGPRYELDFGGVLVNEVPTFRTDQMPYGGVRDSGNTKEGPHYAVREMTRERLVIIQR